MYQIKVDTREPKELKEKLKKSFEVIEEQLEVGDIYIPHVDVYIERKTLHDLFNSAFQGEKRLWDQLKALSNLNSLVVISTNNKWRVFYFRKQRFLHKTYPSLLVAITKSFNVPILQIDSDEELVYIIEALCKINEPSTRPIPKITQKISSDKEIVENILASFPSIGVKLAIRLLKKYGTLNNVIEAIKSNDIEVLKTIGKKAAETVKYYLDFKYEEV